jgi:Arc/MetJ-type ribon-helix-helix transcriptional regulator
LEVELMNIRLTRAQEKIVKEELESGHFRTAEEVIAEALQALKDKGRPSNEDNGKQREAVREMLVFVEKNRVRLEGVSVKDLIHEGHPL